MSDDLIFPRVIYRPGGRPGQIDHPGYDARVITVAAWADAQAEGWTLTPTPAVAPAPESTVPPPVKKRGRPRLH